MDHGAPQVISPASGQSVPGRKNASLPSTLNAWLTSRYSVPLALLLLSLLNFGPLISSLGLYWDDWPSLWFLHNWGPTSFVQGFSIDRPLQGWLFILTTSLVGQSMLAWQVFGILTRWLSTLAFGWMLSCLWPEQKTRHLWMMILFLIYPGFLQQYIPFTYSHMFIIQAATFISLGLMVWALRHPTKYWPATLGSAAIAAASMIALEYFFGLELLRPVFLWIVWSQVSASHTPRPGLVAAMKNTLRYWLPYMVANAGFLAYRLSHKTPRAEITIFQNLASDPQSTMIHLAQSILQDLFEVNALAWAKAASFLNLTGVKTSVILVYISILLATGVLTIIYLLKLPIQPASNTQSRGAAYRSALLLCLLGLYALLSAGWPFWPTDLHIELRFPWDRFTLAMMPGTAILSVGLLELLRPRWIKVIIIGIAAALAAGAQFNYALQYRLEWIVQKDFFNQWVWRAPGIQPGALLLTSNIPFTALTDNTITAPINWIYAPENTNRAMSYLVYDVDARLGNRLPALKPGLPIQQDYRVTHFTGSTSQVLVFFYDPPRCLKVIDPAIDANLPNKPNSLILAFPLSNPGLIQAQPSLPARLPEQAFGPSAAPQNASDLPWCYYYEQADLARQFNDWQKVTALAEQAQVNNRLTTLNRENAYELLTFIEGYARTGQAELAWQISLQAYKLNEKVQPMICETWQRSLPDLSTYPTFNANEIKTLLAQKLHCQLP